VCVVKIEARVFNGFFQTSKNVDIFERKAVFLL
jgi:hypothetical protein